MVPTGRALIIVQSTADCLCSESTRGPFLLDLRAVHLSDAERLNLAVLRTSRAKLSIISAAAAGACARHESQKDDRKARLRAAKAERFSECCSIDRHRGRGRLLLRDPARPAPSRSIVVRAHEQLSAIASECFPCSLKRRLSKMSRTHFSRLIAKASAANDPVRYILLYTLFFT